MTRIRLGTRGSRLAVVQASLVARRLESRNPGLSVDLVELRNSGDRRRDAPLGPDLGQSVFTREIERALLDGRVDLAVHSCKDLATTNPPGLRLAAVPEREDPRDALVSAGPALADLPEGARIGTCSPRRRAFLASARPDLRFADLRGNVPTRLRAVEEGEVDAAVVALAGLRRLGLDGRAAEILEPDIMLPAAAQGALAVQIRDEHDPISEIVAAIDDAEAHAAVASERACLHALEAGCHAPVGALAEARGGTLSLTVAVLAPDRTVRTSASAPASDPESVGAAAARDALAALGIDSLRGLDWAGPPPARSVPASDQEVP